MPRSVICHICGREFGTSSIGIHIPQCTKKWEAQETKKPKAKQRPVPTAPPEDAGGTNLGGTSRESRESYNEAALQKWNDEALLPCPVCGRTFLPDRLEIHQRSCRPPPGTPAPRPRPAAKSVASSSADGLDDSPTRRTASVSGSDDSPPGKPGPPLSSAALRQDKVERSTRASVIGSDESPPGKTGPPLRPRAVVCHICGREFGTKSIDIHVPQCTKKWEEREQQKPEHTRRLVPSAPELEANKSSPAYNEAALEKWNTEALLACPNCGRTFLPDRLEVHLRSCRSKDGTVASVPVPSLPLQEPDFSDQKAKPKAAVSKPQSVVCHICGREFGSKSIAIHLPQCQKKWEDSEKNKPKREQRSVPTAPVREAGVGRREYNEAALQTWNDEALVACANCGRTFLPDRLDVHLRSCKGDGSAAPRPVAAAAAAADEVSEVPASGSQEVRDARKSLTPASARAASGSRGTPSSARSASGTRGMPPAIAKPRSVVCHICGREFGTKSIDIHVPQCAKKWEEREQSKPGHDRRPVPTAPVEQTNRSTPAYNEAALEKWNTEALMACPNCGRTFLPDRLEVHLRSCKPQDGAPAPRAAVSSPGPSGPPAPEDGAAEAFSPPPRAAPAAKTPRPRTVVCQVCGREFGSASIDIHRRQCEERWRTQEAKKPEKDRKPVPEAPIREAGIGREQYNEVALQKWNDEALAACPNCGRTFLPDRLEVHLRSCKPKQ